jgi:hypothetical protein
MRWFECESDEYELPALRPDTYGNPHGGPLPGVEELSRRSREVRVKLLENSETVTVHSPP